MTQIGSFTKEDDFYRGTITTLGLCADLWILVAPLTDAEHAPDYRIHLGAEDGPDIGAGWKRVGEKAGEYVAIVIDDPSLAAPIRANLFQATGQWDSHLLIWNRPSKRAATP